MAKEVGNEPFEGTISSVFANLSLYQEAVYAYIASIGVFLLIFSINAYDMVTNHWEVIEEAITEDSWSLNFNEEVEILEESRVLQDGEMQTYTFYMDDIEIPPDFLIGEINITVDDSDTDDGLIANLDPTNECDSVLADIREGGLTAQWEDENNSLSGQTNDCEPFYLYLRVYPKYDGELKNSNSVNEYQALLPWQEEGWGVGELEIDIEVNTDDSAIPGQSSDDEEITVTVQIVLFQVGATENN